MGRDREYLDGRVKILKDLNKYTKEKVQQGQI